MDHRPKMNHTAKTCQPFSGQAATEVFEALPKEKREEFHRQYCLNLPRSQASTGNIINEVLDLMTDRRFRNADLKQ